MKNHFDTVEEIAKALGPLPLVRMDPRDRLTLAIPIILFLSGVKPSQEDWRGFSICTSHQVGCIALPHLHIPVAVYASVEAEAPAQVVACDVRKEHGPNSQ